MSNNHPDRLSAGSNPLPEKVGFVSPRMVREVNRVSRLLQNIDGQNGIQVTGYGDRLTIAGRRVAAGANNMSFSASLTNGVAAGAEGKVTIAAGWIEHHGPDGSFYEKVNSRYTGDGTLAALSANFNVIYIDWTIGTSTSALGIASSTTEELALNAVDADATSILKPLLCVQYDTTSHVVTMERVYHQGNWAPHGLFARTT